MQYIRNSVVNFLIKVKWQNLNFRLSDFSSNARDLLDSAFILLLSSDSVIDALTRSFTWVCDYRRTTTCQQLICGSLAFSLICKLAGAVAVLTVLFSMLIFRCRTPSSNSSMQSSATALSFNFGPSEKTVQVKSCQTMVFSFRCVTCARLFASMYRSSNAILGWLSKTSTKNWRCCYRRAICRSHA